jgi:hypothetical protein
VLDLTDPEQPEVEANVTLDECVEIHDLFVSGERAYVNCLDDRLLVVDISEPTNWIVLDTIAQVRSHSSWQQLIGDRSLLLFSNEAFAASLELAWVGDDGQLTRLDPISMGTAGAIHTLQCVDSSCFVSAYQQGWLEIDVSSPKTPSILHHQFTWRGPGIAFYEGATGIALQNNTLFVADTERGLLAYQRTLTD